ncbi:hypothetical protein WJX72_003448 [[Myrmecia] bisecta]|uniref:DUF7798 domain-containing protein n=1 Tax=[Myrmecia] bisecta TaxID=41462 RepID=A0AAW1QEM6_9CHLO
MDDDLTQEDIDEWATVEGIDEVISASESPQSPQGSDADKEQFPQEPAKLGASLREVAAGAARDVRELTDSFQQVLQEVLERLQGEDTSLELGLAAIDDQVEQLAQGVSQTFGSLWGGARGVLRGGLTYGQRVAERLEEAAAAAAKELAETVEEGVRDASSGLAAAAGNTRRVGGLLASRAEHGLEEFGRQAIELLEGDLPPGGAAARRIAGEEATFDHCFYIYGGRQSLEELEALSNECARVCNRLRARLPDADKAQLDSTLTMLSPLFNLEGQAGGDEAAAGAEGGAAVDSPLARGHAVVVELRNAGVAKASKLVTELSERSTRPAATTAPGLAGTQGAPADSEQAEALQRVRGEGVRCLGELAALCVERMLALARSVSAQFRFSRPTDDDIQWPPGCKDKAALLCAQAKLMLTDLETLASAKALGKELGADCTAAQGRVQEAYRGLMYVVLLTTLDRSLLEAR